MSHDPYALAVPAVPKFAVHSKDFTDGGPLPDTAYQPVSTPPHLSWSGLPGDTQSLVVTAFDADAPIPGGFWHWAVKDIPPAGGPSLGVLLPNSLGQRKYIGANPPPGTGTHRVFFCVTALSVTTLEAPSEASLALLHIMLIPHTLARGIITGTSTPRD
ncbi:YbhB/YbcL family Raf kinase inhibitor-like protein [Actinocorallia longicatena]|uniref:YbhB/YbcL family Raf kinase inhibitor-like protein n=1 Tax=Actinocorallia longicatena TaxID=111803 RepID=A0ABP6Q7X4_9ACTN